MTYKFSLLNYFHRCKLSGLYVYLFDQITLNKKLHENHRKKKQFILLCYAERRELPKFYYYIHVLNSHLFTLLHLVIL